MTLLTEWDGVYKRDFRSGWGAALRASCMPSTRSITELTPLSLEKLLELNTWQPDLGHLSSPLTKLSVPAPPRQTQCPAAYGPGGQF